MILKITELELGKYLYILVSCKISSKDMILFPEKNIEKLQELYISDNNIGNIGAKHLAKTY